MLSQPLFGWHNCTVPKGPILFPLFSSARSRNAGHALLDFRTKTNPLITYFSALHFSYRKMNTGSWGDLSAQFQIWDHFHVKQPQQLLSYRAKLCFGETKEKVISQLHSFSLFPLPYYFDLKPSMHCNQCSDAAAQSLFVLPCPALC